jgi:hypothetical protein
MEQKADFQERAIALILPELPANAEEAVVNAVRRHEDAVRLKIRSETGLRLSDANLKNNAPVRVVPGFPLPFAQLISDNDDAVLWRIIMMRPLINAACGVLDSLLDSWSHLEHWTNLPAIARGGAPTLERAQAILQSLRDAYQREHVKHDGSLSAHLSLPVRYGDGALAPMQGGKTQARRRSRRSFAGPLGGNRRGCLRAKL